MNIIEAMKRSHETGEKVRRREWTNKEICYALVNHHQLYSEDLIADDWEAVPSVERTAGDFVSADGSLLAKSKVSEEFIASAEDAKRIADAPDGKVIDVAEWKRRIDEAIKKRMEAERLAKLGFGPVQNWDFDLAGAFRDASEGKGLSAKEQEAISAALRPADEPNIVKREE